MGTVSAVTLGEGLERIYRLSRRLNYKNLAYWSTYTSPLYYINGGHTLTHSCLPQCRRSISVGFDEGSRERGVEVAVELIRRTLRVLQGDLLTGSDVHDGPEGGLVPEPMPTVSNTLSDAMSVHEDGSVYLFVRTGIGHETGLKPSSQNWKRWR